MSDAGPREEVGGNSPRAVPRRAVSVNMLTTLVGNFFPPLVALITGPILARALAVDGRGAVAAAIAPLALVTTIATFGLPEAVTYTVARHPHLHRIVKRRGALILTIAGLFATVAVILARQWLSGGDPEIAALIVIASFAIIPNLLVGVLRSVASATQQWRRVAGEKILASVLRLLALIPFWVTGTLSPLNATIILAVMPVMGALAYIGVSRSAPIGRYDDVAARYASLSQYGARIWIGSISGILLSRIDQTLMTPLSGSYQLGLYVVAVSVSELPLIINSAVRDVTFATDSKESVNSRLTASARISSTASALAGAFLAITMLWWLPLLFGEDFAAAIPVAAVLLLGVVVGTPGSIGGAGLSGRGRPGLRSISLIVACLVNIALLIVLVPIMGAFGAGLATLVGNFISSNLNLIFLKRVFGVPIMDFYGFRRSDVAILRTFVRRLRPKGRTTK